MEERLEAIEARLKALEGLVGQVKIEQVKLLKLFVVLWIELDALHAG